MKVRFLTLAQQEVDDAVVWLEERVEGKGVDFLVELARVVRLIEDEAYDGPVPVLMPDPYKRFRMYHALLKEALTMCGE